MTSDHKMNSNMFRILDNIQVLLSGKKQLTSMIERLLDVGSIRPCTGNTPIVFTGLLLFLQNCTFSPQISRVCLTKSNKSSEDGNRQILPHLKPSYSPKLSPIVPPNAFAKEEAVPNSAASNGKWAKMCEIPFFYSKSEHTSFIPKRKSHASWCEMINSTFF